MFSRSKKSLSLILAALAVLPVEAAQLIDNSDKQHVQVNVSAAEANRLAIQGRRIVNVVPGQPGLIRAKKDEAQGALYFSMAPDRQEMGTVTLFVSDDQDTTYKLTLVPRPIPGEDIIVRPPQAKAAPAGAEGGARSTSYQRRINDLILSMASVDSGAGSAEVVQVNKEVPLWQEARLLLVSKHIGRDVVGEKYRLTNISSTDMLLVEQELFRRGVHAVSITHHTLAPGNSTDIFIVRERKDHE